MIDRGRTSLVLRTPISEEQLSNSNLKELRPSVISSSFLWEDVLGSSGISFYDLLIVLFCQSGISRDCS